MPVTANAATRSPSRCRPACQRTVGDARHAVLSCYGRRDLLGDTDRLRKALTAKP